VLASRSIAVWSAGTYAGYQEVAKLNGHRSTVHAIRFLSDGNTLVSASRDELIRWRAAPLAETDAQR
jgi:WD40 repeat protein